MKVGKRTSQDLFPVLTLEQMDKVEPSEVVPRPIYPVTQAIQRDFGFLFDRQMESSKLQALSLKFSARSLRP